MCIGCACFHFTLNVSCSFMVSIVNDNHQLALWLSGNALASINVVAPHQTRLVPGCGQVNHLSM